jgi:catechol 2,3-dioxygenase-like lactoylglutathione lyase family enzyme
MAYRFLLEVPETLAAEANIAVSEAGDAQVVVVRNSHGRNLDEPYVDLTVAAHSLRVIYTLSDWFSQMGPSRPDIRIVLHGGDRLALAEHDRGTLVAAIRRDQPWVERTIPKIGEHEVESFSALDQEAELIAALTSPNNSTATLERTWSTLPAVQEPVGGRKVAIRELNHFAVRVMDLEKAELFYTSFMSMDLVGRARRNGAGGYNAVEPDYSWEEATRKGREADISFLRNGPLVLALHRQGRGARLDRDLLDHISIRVDAVTFTAIKGQVLMQQAMEVVASTETAFAFRDPMGITWEIVLQSVPDFM